MNSTFLRLAVIALTAAPFTSGGMAQDAPPRLAVTLNALEDRDGSCRMSFVVRNAMDVEIDDLGLEIAIFRDGGALDRLMRLGLGQMLRGKTRVRQFDIEGTSCDGIEAVLLNDVIQCSGGELTPLTCLRAMDVQSTTAVGFGL